MGVLIGIGELGMAQSGFRFNGIFERGGWWLAWARRGGGPHVCIPENQNPRVSVSSAGEPKLRNQEYFDSPSPTFPTC